MRLPTLVFVIVALTVANALGPFPLESVVNLATSNIEAASKPTATGLSKNDYLQTIAGITNYFETLQSSSGTIIDPYENREIQYATPCFAHAAIVQGLIQNDPTVVQSGVKALNASLTNLINNACADGHCNFFTLPIMLAIETLQPHISASLFNYYISQANKITVGLYINLDINWAIVAAGGEYLRYLHGLTTLTWIDGRLAVHVPLFSDNGMYQDPTPATNPSTAYDIFPRVYLQYMTYRGYNGSYLANLTDILERSSPVSLLLQSPQGEWPTGGRSSQHMWNEGVQCALYEMRANIHWQRGEVALAQAFKRAARLAHIALKKYISEHGYGYVVHNRMDPAKRFGYETYSYLTNYNALPASMLALAYQIADDSIPEGPTFAETGGFAFGIPSHHKVIANVQGNYFEWETYGDPEYDSTGLTRNHHPAIPTLLGPSGGGTGVASSGGIGGGPPTAVGLGWTKGGVSEVLAQFGTTTMSPAVFNLTSISNTQAEFYITYPLTASALGVTSVVETVVIDSSSITVTASVTGTVDTVDIHYPVFLWDGTYNTTFDVSGNTVVTNGGVGQTFTVVEPAGATLQYEGQYTYSRNGYLGRASVSVSPTSPVVYTLAHGVTAAPSTYTVGASDADYTTISAALTAITSLNVAYILEIQAGTYHEQVHVTAPNGIIRPASGAAVTISFAAPIGAAVLYIEAANVKVYDITVVTTFAQGSGASSALQVSSTAASFYGCTFLGFQGTIAFTGASFTGYFSEAYVEGASDVISGTGLGYFDASTIASNGAGSIAAHQGASSTSSDKFIFNDVSLVATTPNALLAPQASASLSYSSADVTATNYLGRPVGSFSRVVYMFTNMPKHINPAGWNGDGQLFGEFQNTGASGLFSFNRVGGVFLSGDEADAYSVRSAFGADVFGQDPAWIDAAYIPQCGFIFAQCGGEGYTGLTCCDTPYSCVAQSTNYSHCAYVPLSSRGTGTGNVYTSGTIALSTIFVHNPFGGVTTTLSTTNLQAYYNASYSNAVIEAIVPTVVTQMSPIPAINITLGYSTLSDPRGVAVDLHINLPIGSRVHVISV